MNHQGVFALPLVKVKEKFQITLPAELRAALHLAVGDLLEATIEDNVIVLKPQVVIAREQAWAKIEHAMKKAEKVEKKQLEADTAEIEKDAKAEAEQN